ncbi:outer membrane beta-barrel protein [Fulvivirgaceae bacterium PWU4]|uniref:Outer membrane beta-barrel protein n=1 Tax=Chryseosolibacter histidini TaxID=2782349 RepID=A0AAP2DLW8_9BACT|nr:porin family protein [Chryseosolibacter histidini]MBT1698745.1 outer membrane beta-barrel protein [Chryseosolibacter histidini]
MRKILLLVVASVAFWSAKAQVSFKIKGGANLNGMAEKPFDLPDAKERSAFSGKKMTNIGFHAGAAANIKVAGRFGFQPELVLFQRGIYQDKIRVNVNYLDLPLLADVSLHKKINVQFGPVLSYVLWARGYSYVKGKRADVTDGIEPFNVGVTGGLVFDVTEKIAVYAHYYNSFLYTWDVSYRDENNLPRGGVEFYNRNISLGVAYQLN